MKTPCSADTPQSAGALVLVFFLLAVGASASSGYLRTGAPTEWIGLACVTAAAVLWLCCARWRALPPLRAIAAAVLVICSMAQPFFLWRMVHHQEGVWVVAMRTLSLVALAVVALYVALLFGRLLENRWRQRLFLLLVGVALALRVLMVLDSPDPGTDKERFLSSWASDVWSFTNFGAEGLLRGENPYTLSYPPLTESGRGLWDYYTYPPGFLLLSLPGVALFGDVRYTHVLAMLAAAWLLYGLARGAPVRERELLVLLLLYHPRSLYLQEQAFTEPVVAMVALGMAAAAAAGHVGTMGILLGLLTMTKQYGIAFFPALLRERAPARAWLGAAAVVAAMLGPFTLWNAAALWDNILFLFMRVLPAYDGLNWTTATHHLGWKGVVSLMPLAAVGALVVLWRQPRGAAGFVGSGSLILLQCFLFGRYAFFNYYWLAGVLALTHAALLMREAAGGEGENGRRTA